MLTVLNGISSRNGVRHSLRQRGSLSLSFPAIGMKVTLAAVIVADASSGVIVAIRFRAGRKRSVDRRLKSNR